MRAWLVFALALTTASPAASDSCSQYEEPLAYNACLARQGPQARNVNVRKAPVGRKAARSPRRTFAAATRRGRSEMVFTFRR